MKTFIAISISVLAIQFSVAQCPISFYDLEKLIPRETEMALEVWAQKGEYESSRNYQRRVKGQFELKKKMFADSIINFYKGRYIKKLPPLKYEILGSYDADRQVFESEINCLGTFFLPVPREEARVFAGDKKKKVKHKDFAIVGNDWQLSEVEIYSPKLKKSFRYSSSQILEFIPQATIGSYDKIPSYEEPQKGPSSEIVFEQPDHPRPDGDYDIYENLPKTKNTSENAIAVIIGNQTYDKAGNVDFAIQDGKAIRKYLIEVLGYQSDNILFYSDIQKSEFEEIFGSHDNHRGKLYNKSQRGESDIFVYYSGHGAPGLNNQKAYFLPVNCDPSAAEFSGYSLNLFLQNLAKIPANSKTVVIDACFSGIDIIDGVSAPPPVRIRQKTNEYDDGKTIVLTSSKSNQVSTWYYGKEQGLFTYFFLKAIHDYENSDQNEDGQLTFQEIFDYVSNKRNGVPYCASILKNGVLQTPVVVMGERRLNEGFVDYE